MSKQFHRDLLRGRMDLMVLSVLADGANYDYLIQKHIREPGHGWVQLLVGTLYSLLHRLESDGAIRSKWDAKTGRNRKWHELTEAGLTASTSSGQSVGPIRHLYSSVAHGSCR